MLDLNTIENRVRDLDELLTEFKPEKHSAMTMIRYHLEEARDALIKLHYLISTHQIYLKEPTE